MAFNKQASMIVTLEAQTEKYQKELATASKKVAQFEKRQGKALRAIQKQWLKFGAIASITAMTIHVHRGKGDIAVRGIVNSLGILLGAATPEVQKKFMDHIDELREAVECKG